MLFINEVPLIGFLVIAFTILWRIIWLKNRGIKVIHGKKNNNPFQWLLFPVFVVLLILWLYEIIQPVFFKMRSVVPEFVTKMWIDANPLKITGTSLIAISLVLLITTLLHFKTSLRFGLNQNNPGKLIKSGVFAITRNPFFISLDFYFLGIALIFPNLFFVGFAVLAIISIHFFILKEEKFLIKVYGEEYEEYAKKVGRYF